MTPPSDPRDPSSGESSGRRAARPELFPIDPPAPPKAAEPLKESAKAPPQDPLGDPAADPAKSLMDRVTEKAAETPAARLIPTPLPQAAPPPAPEAPRPAAPQPEPAARPEARPHVFSAASAPREDKPAPFLLKGDQVPPPPEFSAQDAPQPDSLPAEAAAPAAVSAALMARGSTLGRLFWWAFGGFVTLALSLAAYEVVAGLIARNLWLGRAALALLAISVLALLLMAARELAALSRLKKTEATQILAARALRHADRPAAEAALKDLEALASGRPELAAAREKVLALKGDQPDAAGLIALAERSYLAGPDASARAAAAQGARNAAVATALIPAGILDAAVILIVNLRMIRRIAQSYGGRGGWLGGWRLMRQVAAHLAATGAVALADDLLGPALGGGAVAKVSRRFGEGLLNGALTARVGVAAMEVCRPLPFHALSRPSARSIAAEGLKGLADRSAPAEPEERR